MTENQNAEWKTSWHDEYLKWLCGFANAQGGVLEIGRNDDGEIVGLDDAERLLEVLPNKLRNSLGIVGKVELLKEGSHSYLRIEIDPYPVPISFRGEYHYRSGSTKQVLAGAALDRFLLGKTGRCWDAAPIPGVEISDLDTKTFDDFRALGRRSGRLSASALEDNKLNLAEKLHLTENGYLKRAAVLLFHPDPEKYFTGASIKIGYFASVSDLRYQDEVCGNLFAQVSKTMDLLTTKYMKAMISYEGIQRIETFPVPREALRETLLNAVIHRDYGSSAQIQIRVYANRLKIWNPGSLPAGWSLEKLLGEHPSQPPNPDIANAFFRAGEIESWGRGIKRIFDACRESGTPEPAIEVYPEISMEFKFSQSYLESTRFGGANDGFGNNQARAIESSDIQEKILTLLRDKPELTRKSVAELIGITLGSTRYHFESLRETGRIQRVGSKKNGRWEVVANHPNRDVH